jgi:acetyltransferase
MLAMMNETIEPLRLPTPAADEEQLIELLTACVHGGASMGFLAPLARAEAEEYWKKIFGEYAHGARLLLVARDPQSGRIIGAGQLAFERRSNGRHRAEVQKLLVLPAHRRRGIATRLMRRIEAEAEQRSLRLLFLDTSVGPGGAVELYRTLGYTPAGGIPDYAMDPDGSLKPNAIFYRLLEAKPPLK